MTYDTWKLQTPKTFGDNHQNENCACGRKKKICDSFCSLCKSEIKEGKKLLICGQLVTKMSGKKSN